MDGGTTRLTVGELARAAGMTAKALRHYDQLGLFRPDGVDEGNGYRWYGADRVPQARLIARLRGVGLPLEAVAECLGSGGDPDVVDRVLEQHRRRLESRMTRVRGDLHRLTHLIEDGTEDEMDSETAHELPTARAADDPPAAPGRAQARGRPVQRRLGADGDRGPHPGPGRPDAAHGPRVAPSLGAGRHTGQPGPR